MDEIPKKKTEKLGNSDSLSNSETNDGLIKESELLKRELKEIEEQDEKEKLKEKKTGNISFFRAHVRRFWIFYDSESPKSIAFRWTLSTVAISASPFLIAMLITGLWGIQNTITYVETVVKEGEFMFIAASIAGASFIDYLYNKENLKIKFASQRKIMTIFVLLLVFVVVIYSALKIPFLNEFKDKYPINSGLLVVYTVGAIFWSVGYGYRVKKIVEESKRIV